MNISIISGSTRNDSVNTKLARYVEKKINTQAHNTTFIDIGRYPLPFYDALLEKNEGMPKNSKEIRNQLLKSSLIIIASPEYNASVPAVLKNIIDWCSRSEQGTPSKDAFQGKTCLLLSASPGKLGGMRGLKHLKEILENLGAQVHPNTFSLPLAYEAFDPEGNLLDPQLKQQLDTLVHSLID